MRRELADADLELLREPNYAQLVTLDADGSPQVSIVWVDAEDGHVLVNTAEGRRKDRNMRRDPRVAVLVARNGDAYRWVAVEGRVVERVTGPLADAHIDALSRKYDGTPWTPVEGQVRVLYRIRPDRIVRYGG
ncbi:MAG TPA: PPOX class F420-dependent oxidoreductase [Actinomycetota bacterium]|jgi:PPOX class probable F420-dependent enzyme|nr:PPOX class F420-dependent oxidoreductase [Actinomycetota bacterium]